MDTNSKSDNTKSKRANRKILNYCNSRNKTYNEKYIQRYTLPVKRRGLYVNSSPTELGINDNLVINPNCPNSNQQALRKPLGEGVFKISKFSQRDCRFTSSINNHNSSTQEVVKTKRRLKKRKIINKEVFNVSDQSTVDETNAKRRTKQKKAIENRTDDIVCVLQSRTNIRADITESSRSKKSFNSNHSIINFKRDVREAYFIPNERFESRFDKTAAEVLQGWITTKETALTENVENSNVIKKTETHGYNTPNKLAPAVNCKEDNRRKLPSCTGNEMSTSTAPNCVAKRLTFDISEHLDILGPHLNAPRKFTTTEILPTVKKKCYARRPSKATGHIQVHYYNNHKNFKRNSKREFMDLIKRELKNTKCSLDKPRSMFETLKMSVRNKQLSERDFY